MTDSSAPPNKPDKPARPRPLKPSDLTGNTVYLIARVFFRAFYRALGGLRSYGLENIPPTGPVLFAANHNSHLDPPLVGTDMDRVTWFMAKEELFEPPLFRNLMYGLHGFPVKRHSADRAALRLALALLEEGQTVTVFIEGERSRDGQLKPAEPGVAMIALRSRATVIPVGIKGTGEILPPGTKWFRPGKLRITYGKPVDLSDLYGKRETREVLYEAADRIMAAVAALLGVPPPVREEAGEVSKDIRA
ncbi:MAG: 1-acyl-sn-glycerol-3-phosphate acyltransferase [Armatimonadetes bacterium]|nr:1-acyl-sn-glycerol-3-phosphate acyltransferase [Armatimonadota bacterium]